MSSKARTAPLTQEQIDRIWFDTLVTGTFEHSRLIRRIHMLLPGEPRCNHCAAPFGGIGGLIVRAVRRIQPSRMNPRYCNDCELFAERHPGGTEVDLAMLFVDLRGSTTIAERMTPREFTRLVDRFHQSVTRILVHSDALVEKLVGDQLTGLYLPGYVGPNYARCALEAALEIKRHWSNKDEHAGHMPVGIGVHVGRAYVGSVGSRDGIVEITALGDDVNTAARLCQMAGAGELVVSEAAFRAGAVTLPEGSTLSQPREVSLKGRIGAVTIRSIR